MLLILSGLQEINCFSSLRYWWTNRNIWTASAATDTNTAGFRSKNDWIWHSCYVHYSGIWISDSIAATTTWPFWSGTNETVWWFNFWRPYYKSTRSHVWNTIKHRFRIRYTATSMVLFLSKYQMFRFFV